MKHLRPTVGLWIFGCGALTLVGCGPTCERYDVLRIDLTRGTGQGPSADLVYSEGAGGLKVQVGTAEPSFSPLEAALIGSATSTGTARLSANFGSDQLLVLELPFPRRPGDTLRVDTLLDDVRFTGGYEGYGWWDSKWSWRDSPGPSKATLLALFEETPGATAVSGTVTVAGITPLILELDLLVSDRRARTLAVYARATADRSLGQELCGP